METCLILLNLQISLLGQPELFTACDTKDPEAPTRNHLVIPWRNWICLLQFLGFRPSEAFLSNIVSGGQWSALIHWRQICSRNMSYFHCKFRDLKYKSIQDSFQDSKDFNKKSRIFYADDKIMKQTWSFCLKLVLYFFLCWIWMEILWWISSRWNVIS